VVRCVLNSPLSTASFACLSIVCNFWRKFETWSMGSTSLVFDRLIFPKVSVSLYRS
jgi:hypothetical protein